jgi:hypothetical protein
LGNFEAFGGGGGGAFFDALEVGGLVIFKLFVGDALLCSSAVSYFALGGEREREREESLEALEIFGGGGGGGPFFAALAIGGLSTGEDGFSPSFGLLEEAVGGVGLGCSSEESETIEVTEG